jgi:hypothetical protein
MVSSEDFARKVVSAEKGILRFANLGLILQQTLHRFYGTEGIGSGLVGVEVGLDHVKFDSNSQLNIKEQY